LIKKGKKVSIKKKVTNKVSQKVNDPEEMQRLNDLVSIANSHLASEKNKDNSNNGKIMANFSIRVSNDNEY